MCPDYPKRLRLAIVVAKVAWISDFQVDKIGDAFPAAQRFTRPAWQNQTGVQ
jgi:hypothetical protein